MSLSATQQSSVIAGVGWRGSPAELKGLLTFTPKLIGSSLFGLGLSMVLCATLAIMIHLRPDTSPWIRVIGIIAASILGSIAGIKLIQVLLNCHTLCRPSR